jgi:gas vesicle protein
MNDIEQKRKRIETIAKVIGLCVAAFFFAPIAFLTIKGLVSLIVVGVIALFTVNVGIPWFAISLANWRLKALKSAASANPIETLENQYKDRMDALAKIRENITASYAVLQDLHTQIQEHDEKYPNKPSQYLDKYQKLSALIALRGSKYKQAQKNLADFAEVIEEKRSDWKIAQTMAQANKLANVGQDFQSKLLQDTALNTVQDGLNTAFAELETSLLDEQSDDSAPAKSTTVVEIAPARPTAQLRAPSLPPLDLDFTHTTDVEEVEPDPVPVKSARNRRSY